MKANPAAPLVALPAPRLQLYALPYQALQPLVPMPHVSAPGRLAPVRHHPGGEVRQWRRLGSTKPLQHQGYVLLWQGAIAPMLSLEPTAVLRAAMPWLAARILWAAAGTVPLEVGTQLAEQPIPESGLGA